MRVILQIDNQGELGRKSWAKSGERITVGRSDRADFVVANDPRMSDAHFVIVCTESEARIRELGSVSGTSVNGKKIVDTVLRDGDVIRAGTTSFVVSIDGLRGSPAPPIVERIPAGETAGPKASQTELVQIGSSPLQPHSPSYCGGWTFGTVPEDWETVDDFAIKRIGNDTFPSNVVLIHEALDAQSTLADYIGRQLEMMQTQFQGLEVGTQSAATVAGAEEAVTLDIRYSLSSDMQIIQRQIYAQRDNSVGVATFTTTSTQRQHDQASFETIAKSLRLGSLPNT